MTDSTKIVVIVADKDDYHAIGVANAVASCAGKPVIVDNSDFPTKIQLSHYDNTVDGIESFLRFADGTCVNLASVTGVWWRRPQKYKIDSDVAHPTLKRFAFDESREAFLGALAASVKNFVNPVGHSRYATHKLIQLRKARELGISTPRTLVTNDPNDAQQFAKRNGRVVYKTFTGCDFGFFETRILKESAFPDLEKLRLAPVILQEEISGNLDIRATVVGNEVYSAELHLEHSSHPVDGRIDRVPIKPHKLPNNLQQKLITLTRSFGLIYSAIDLRLTSNGEYVFFELNPEGQFLWVEIEAKLGICEALAKRLLTSGKHIQGENLQSVAEAEQAF